MQILIIYQLRQQQMDSFFQLFFNRTLGVGVVHLTCLDCKMQSLERKIPVHYIYTPNVEPVWYKLSFNVMRGFRIIFNGNIAPKKDAHVAWFLASRNLVKV